LAHLGELVDLGVDLDHLGLGALVQLAGAAPMLGQLQQLLDLGQGEPQALDGLDGAQQPDRVLGISRCPEGRRVGAARSPRRS
jgi:hypothetical protein